MVLDPRGGHNRRLVDEAFFKTWSYKMAYVLGYIFADGALIDARESSRTQYLTMASVDKNLLVQVRKVLNSNHDIYSKKAYKAVFGEKIYGCAECFILRIGNKRLYGDLIQYGLTPRKSLSIQVPNIEPKFFPFFLRGYFDGDGCIYCSQDPVSKDKLVVIFTSGSKVFLEEIRLRLTRYLSIGCGSLHTSGTVSRLRYRLRDGLKIMGYLYQQLDQTPCLKRKYKIYTRYLASR